MQETFKIGQLRWNGDEFLRDDDGGGIIDWFKYNSLNIVKEFIVKDFQEMEKYAEVWGRCDNISLRYTGEWEALTTEQRNDYFSGGDKTGVPSYDTNKSSSSINSKTPIPVIRKANESSFSKLGGEISAKRSSKSGKGVKKVR